jgi:hypothetical protein
MEGGTMADVSPVFQQTREVYLERIASVDWARAAEALGFATTPAGHDIRLFDRTYTVAADEISEADGRPAPFDVLVLLSRYLIMCPETPDHRLAWTAYRDFKDAGPLLKYFADNVEGAVASAFSGRRGDLQRAAEDFGGTPPPDPPAYDAAYRFEALPRIGLLLLFNDADDEFSADCRILFERRTETYLDMECVAILGARLAAGLCRGERP